MNDPHEKAQPSRSERAERDGDQGAKPQRSETEAPKADVEDESILSGPGDPPSRFSPADFPNAPDTSPATTADSAPGTAATAATPTAPAASGATATQVPSSQATATPPTARSRKTPPLAGTPTDTGTAPSPATKEAKGTKAVAVSERRGTVRAIHYTFSYILRNGEAGPRGAIVLLHDLPGGAFTWADALPVLDATGRAVYAFDMLGYDQSEYPWPSDTSIWGHADCLAVAFRRLELSDIVLVGIGQGAAVAQVLATRMYREGIGKLALINSYAYEYAYAPAWPLPEMEKRHDPEAPKHTPLDDVLSDLRAALPGGSAKPKYLTGSKLDAYVNGWKSEVGKEMLFQHVRLMVPGYMNSVGSDLRKLTMPVLLIWSEGDGVTPIALGERMAREIPGARLERIPDSGHLALDDAPEAVGKLIAEFARASTAVGKAR